MSKNKKELIRIVAPALRGVLGTGKKLPRIRFADDCTKTGHCLNISLSGNEPEEIIETLGKGIDLKNLPGCINIEGLGCFTVEPETDKPGDRLSGKVAMVTGAAQGFGFEIAVEMAKQGAFVILGDINAQKIGEAAEQVRGQSDSDKAAGMVMDVTDPVSVSNALDEIVANHGGLDILVANAGVLKAQSVKTLPVKDFDFVASVNYKGYFVCVQSVAEILAVQHQANPQYMSDIIQINSKSGLEGSNCNAAYAGSKFGGIGLTQSFALELIQNGIKVNSICPGNFFDGPLWSDPENGLFVQYLRANKVPGAKTVADVQKAYEAKVPMGRGCRTEDVMKAIYYIVEQDYETGQAVPVTGGQVMLR